MHHAPAIVLALHHLRIYLTGPMAGHHAQNTRAFIDATRHLLGMGASSVYVAQAPDGDIPGIRHDIGELLKADAILFLEGSSRSPRALADYETAKSLGLPLLTLTSDGLRPWTPAEADHYLATHYRPPFTIAS